MFRLLGLLLLCLHTSHAPHAEPPAFPGKVSQWNGFAKHDFDIDGLKTTVVVPAMPLAGRPWVWRGEFLWGVCGCGYRARQSWLALGLRQRAESVRLAQGHHGVGQSLRRTDGQVRASQAAGLHWT